jgi:RND family efflux transporter MFP subunit
VAFGLPQVEVAVADVSTAKAGVAAAKLDLERTKIHAPFAGTVLAENVELGDVVGPGNVLARLVGTKRFLARVAIPVEHLARLTVATDDEHPGSVAKLTQRLADNTAVERTGHVLRITSELDAGSRTGQVLIAVDQPLDPTDGASPLYVGAFVIASIEGRHLGGAVQIPSEALFDGDRVWTLDEEDKLVAATVAIVFSTSTHVVVNGGIAPDDRIIVSALPRAVPGMKVRTSEAPSDG